MPRAGFGQKSIIFALDRHTTMRLKGAKTQNFSLGSRFPRPSNFYDHISYEVTIWHSSFGRG